MIIEVFIDGERCIYVADDVGDNTTCGRPGYKYTHGCRCATCTEWWRAYTADRRRQGHR